MEKPSSSKKSLEEEEVGITVEEDEVCEEESFNRTLVEMIWTDNPYNGRTFKSTSSLGGEESS